MPHSHILPSGNRPLCEMVFERVFLCLKLSCNILKFVKMCTANILSGHFSFSLATAFQIHIQSQKESMFYLSVSIQGCVKIWQEYPTYLVSFLTTDEPPGRRLRPLSGYQNPTNGGLILCLLLVFNQIKLIYVPRHITETKKAVKQ